MCILHKFPPFYYLICSYFICAKCQFVFCLIEKYVKTKCLTDEFSPISTLFFVSIV